MSQNVTFSSHEIWSVNGWYNRGEKYCFYDFWLKSLMIFTLNDLTKGIIGYKRLFLYLDM